jgi:hypothetical protein
MSTQTQFPGEQRVSWQRVLPEAFKTMLALEPYRRSGWRAERRYGSAASGQRARVRVSADSLLR